MDINEILQKVDKLIELNRGPEAERLLQDTIALAIQQEDNGALLQLLNELLGYYRETSQVENSYAIAMQAMALADRMGLKDSIPYATTLLNVANAYRAGGRLGESLELYLTVQDIYDRTLKPDNLLVASFENNLSLLYQEMGDFENAKKALLKALPIVEKKEADWEIAVTHTNLANTCMMLGQKREAYAHALKATECFEALQVEDEHYAAALTALGMYHQEEANYVDALRVYEKAIEIMERNPIRTAYYERLCERYEECCRRLSEAQGMESYNVSEETQKETTDTKTPLSKGVIQTDIQCDGLDLCKRYYETYVEPMLKKDYASWFDQMTIGLVGEGSDCFGFDDAISADHDYGPDVCIWLPDDVYEQIGEKLESSYAQLPTEFEGCFRTGSPQGKGRRGVLRTSDFYKRLLGTDQYESIDFRQIEDSALAACVNGMVFKEASKEQDSFIQMREKLQTGYPEDVLFLKIAQAAARFSQCGQYNLARMLKRNDRVSAKIMWTDWLKEAMRLEHYLSGKYPPHDKWLFKSLAACDNGEELANMIEKLEEQCMDLGDLSTQHFLFDGIEEIARLLSDEMYEKGFISDSSSYLDAHVGELLLKSTVAAKTVNEMAELIARVEFKAFDKVVNEGGRASCQDDWPTFSIMRKSQYMTWNKTMLLQYYYDFVTELEKGHNLITEKYGRMMESTANEEYQKIKSNFPVLTEEKKTIIDSIVAMQVGWMEEFTTQYPCLGDQARSVHSYEDHAYNTSYETYLRGELSTYSDKMLELYGRYVVDHARRGENLAYEIMTNNVLLYGYKSLEQAEAFLEK